MNGGDAHSASTLAAWRRRLDCRRGLLDGPGRSMSLAAFSLATDHAHRCHPRQMQSHVPTDGTETWCVIAQIVPPVDCILTFSLQSFFFPLCDLFTPASLSLRARCRTSPFACDFALRGARLPCTALKNNALWPLDSAFQGGDDDPLTQGQPPSNSRPSLAAHFARKSQCTRHTWMSYWKRKVRHP